MKNYAIHLCGVDDTEVAQSCPGDPSIEHTPAPTGYVAWHEWAKRMSKTHRQVRCKGCGRLSLWVAKVSRKKPGQTALC